MGIFDTGSYAQPGLGWLSALLENPDLLNKGGIAQSKGFSGPVNGTFSGDGSQSSMGGGYGGGVFPSQPTIPQEARDAQAQAPMQPPPFPQAPQQPQANPLSALGNVLANISRGASGKADAYEEHKQSQQALYQALRQKGVDHPTAVAAMSSPEILRELSQFKQPQFVPNIGNDRYGQPQPGFVDPIRQTVSRPNIAGAKPEEQVDPSLTGDAYLQTLPKPEADQVRAMVEGRLAPPGSFALKTPYWQRMLQSASQYEPGFDMTKWSQRQATVKDFASGQSAKNVTALNTVVGHLGDLMEKAEKLGNIESGFGPLNTTANYLKNEYQDRSGAPEVNNFRLARNAVADEMAKVFRSSGMSDHEIQQWKSTINESMTPGQLKGAVKTGISLMESRLSAMTDQRNRGMATSIEPRDLLSDKSKDTLKRVDAWASGSESAAPNAVSFPAPAIAALKKDPNLAAQFDAKYGSGSAAKVLGR